MATRTEFGKIRQRFVFDCEHFQVSNRVRIKRKKSWNRTENSYIDSHYRHASHSLPHPRHLLLHTLKELLADQKKEIRQEEADDLCWIRYRQRRRELEHGFRRQLEEAENYCCVEA